MKNSINTYPYDIAAIILAYLRNEIDEKGQQKLDAWLEEADSHKALFARIQDEGMQYEDIQKILSYDAGGAWQIVKQKAARRKRKRLMRVYQVAASVVVILGVAIAFLLKEEATVVPVAKVEEITPGRSIAKLTVASGDVYHLDSLNQVDLVTSLAENNGKEVVFTDRQLEESVGEIRYNKVEIPRGGEYQIVLGDGTRVYLNAQTELRFPESFANSEQRLVYLSGEAYFEVTKDEARHFNVIMEGATIEVTGTSFNASCYPGEGQCRAVLESGKINLRTEHGVAAVDVGECASYDIVSGKVTVEAVDLKYFTSWRYGTFYFYNTPLSEIVQKLGRWYDVNFKFADESLRDVCFSGAALRSKSIDFMLELLASTQSLKFDIQSDGTILIYKK